MAAKQVISRPVLQGTKRKQVYLQVVMQLTHLMEQRFQSGFQIMYLADYGTGAIMCVPAHDDTRL